MPRWSSYLLFIGFLFACLIGSIMVYIALEHNPQQEFTNNPKSLLPIAYSWIAVVFFPFSLVAAVIAMYQSFYGECTKIRRNVTIIYIGIVLGIIVAAIAYFLGWNNIWFQGHPGEKPLLLFSLIAAISFPFSFAVTILEFIYTSKNCQKRCF